MIEVFGLTKTFTPGTGLLDLFKRRRKVLALDNVDLSIKSGEVCALLGPNGAGKTTLIKILSSLLIPDSGTVLIDGHDVAKRVQAARAKKLIGMVVGEERSFYWRLSGRQNLEFFAALYNLSSNGAKKRIGDVCDMLGIIDLNRRYQECSTGVKQRLAIARCLLSDAKIIFMDEPTRSLDPVAAENLREFIKNKLVKEDGRTVLFSTHHIAEAANIADRIAIINKGAIKACGDMGVLRTVCGNDRADLGDIFKWAVSF